MVKLESLTANLLDAGCEWLNLDSGNASWVLSKTWVKQYLPREKRVPTCCQFHACFWIIWLALNGWHETWYCGGKNIKLWMGCSLESYNQNLKLLFLKRPFGKGTFHCQVSRISCWLLLVAILFVGVWLAIPIESSQEILWATNKYSYLFLTLPNIQNISNPNQYPIYFVGYP